MLPPIKGDTMNKMFNVNYGTIYHDGGVDINGDCCSCGSPMMIHRDKDGNERIVSPCKCAQCCDVCGQYYHNDDLHYDELDGYVCPDCLRPMEWIDLLKYAGEGTHAIDIRLEPDQLDALGFAEYEAGEYTDPLIIHLGDHPWAETVDGVLTYETIDDVEYFLHELGRLYPLASGKVPVKLERL